MGSCGPKIVSERRKFLHRHRPSTGTDSKKLTTTAFFVLLVCLLTLSGQASATGREEAAAAAAIPRMEKALTAKKLKLGNPVFLRIFKEESTLEVWMKPAGGQKFILFKSWPICAWSGSLGSKTKQGDRQAPEGFYAVGPKHLNPFSSYHLSFDLGYPNQYERSKGYTGSLLMIHGNCLSDGCYAMTDAGIEEIYTLVHAALKAGQPFFRVHAFPFHLTDKNLARHRDSAWTDFWLMQRPIYDYFEKHHRPPDVAVTGGRYQISGH